MAERRVESQFDSRSEKLGIDLIYLSSDNVPHTIGKLSTRATNLLETTPQSKVCSQSYGAPKLRKSSMVRFRDSHSGVPREKSHLDVAFMASHRVYYKGEGDGFPQV